MDGNLDLRAAGFVPEKISRGHRERLAIVYIRQSTPQQVERHQESTKLQYALADRAAQFGWPRETIITIDDDLGRSASSVEGRFGFQRLVAEVGLGNVGLVLGLEISRLARSCRDWHQLLEICALFDTLIADTDGVYNPANYNDRLLLGLKGTMSEAELHIIKARMLAGRNAKARRGELHKPLPMGYCRRPSGEVAFDPDEQAQTVIRMVFELFERLGAVSTVLKYLVAHDIKMPVRIASGPSKGDLEWRRPNRQALGDLFKNPIYAGVYVWGARTIDRRRQRPGRRGTGRSPPRPEEAEVFLPDRLPAYITWEQFQRNQDQIQSNRTSQLGPVRAGSALLSGLIVCGRCGLRMQASYNNAGHTARYLCMSMHTTYEDPFCQSLKAAPVDTEVGRQILKAVEPAAIEASLAAVADVKAEREALERHWRQRLERAQHQVDQARRRYASVEPENRLVARTLERDWETVLSEQAKLVAEHERFLRAQPPAPSATDLAQIKELLADLPALWRAQTTSQHERQSLARLLLERVVVTVVGDSEKVQLECHWHGGTRTAHQLVRPVAKLKDLSTYNDLVTRAGELYRAGRTCPEVAKVLNEEGWRPPKRRDTYNGQMVRHLLTRAGVMETKHRAPRLITEKAPDEWTIRDLAQEIGAPESTVYRWVLDGRLSSRSIKINGAHGKLITADAATIANLKAARVASRNRLLASRIASPSPTTHES